MVKAEPEISTWELPPGEDALSPRATGLEEPPPPGGVQDKISILVVDDTAKNLLVYQAILEELGENVVLVASGADALKQVLRQEFAVILLDVNMPDMDGFETALLVRQRRKSALTPIIFLTAFADDVRIAKGYAHGAVDYILTPVVPEILRAKVRVFVELFRMRHQIARRAEEQLALAEQRIALAEERSKRLAAEESSRGLGFLARAGSVLGRSLDFEATLHDLASLPVPFFADVSVVCVTDAVPGGGCRVLVARPAEPGQAIVEEHIGFEHVPNELADGVRLMLDEARAEVAPHTVECGGRIRGAVLPVRARGRMLGVLGLAMCASGRPFGEPELNIADALCSRACVALDNALLHEEVQRADRHKNEFLAMLAHELRNPLGPIRNAVQIFQMIGPQQPELTQARDMIDRQVAHMARLVDDLLDATRIARGMILLRKARCDLVRVVRQTAEDYRSIFEASGLALEVHVPAEAVWVEGDPTRLAQIVGNLLHNAHKFTNPGGCVAVRLQADEAHANLYVQDNGIGIERGLQPHVFDVFAQGDCSLGRSRGGLGLGLALVKGLTELHGGEVTVYSDGPGHGTEFGVRLPLSKPAEPPAQGAGPEPEIGKLRILVVEDNRDAAESTRLLLKLSGHEVRTAYTGQEGLEVAREFRPQVILCDIGLPAGMSGYDVVRELRADPELYGVFVIALTGYGRDEDQREAQEAGFDLHMTKPVDFDKLRRALAGVTARA